MKILDFLLISVSNFEIFAYFFLKKMWKFHNKKCPNRAFFASKTGKFPPPQPPQKLGSLLGGGTQNPKKVAPPGGERGPGLPTQAPPSRGGSSPGGGVQP